MTGPTEEAAREPVVTLRQPSEGVALITLQDRAHKNTFTEELIDGLVDAFRTVSAAEEYRVVVLTGYGNYFATGGTQRDLIAIQEGRMAFTAADTGEVASGTYSLPLDCPVPVIAAMQGHAVGGGLCMGLFSDFVILATESVYTASFMKYGFTPGFGATLVLREKLGGPLAHEFLVTARTYRGADLARRGVPFEVVPRREVLDRALDLARLVAEKPRLSLVTLKDHMVADLRARLPQVIEQELAMHEVTFHQPEVRERILGLYG
ncbi:polyketide biosynthesis enoyl-CoA hydratase PksI [Streptomyces zhaozhouensis]|uniref:Polyketide biosynthesis enoyl-CoA hydratase PksI n=1 Tax=Streptomyces zhaozhouensis TaxID=1300267 RepID=A0A286E075_9ACTN|nr:polyketide synthase [Streptomyces zhaozhouensis]SOD64274.1 polyketide biosynthesis enoyl-CoA hydratase PksI [Streptomyces zhaozhouensis]